MVVARGIGIGAVDGCIEYVAQCAEQGYEYSDRLKNHVSRGRCYAPEFWSAMGGLDGGLGYDNRIE